ncbi:hypothetical protein TURTL08_02550 [Turicimonas sp. TL08]
MLRNSSGRLGNKLKIRKYDLEVHLDEHERVRLSLEEDYEQKSTTLSPVEEEIIKYCLNWSNRYIKKNTLEAAHRAKQ